jgi:transcriptional regulator with AAA-type ATPase domain
MKSTYITWHYTTHGVAYLKHVLSKFYLVGMPDELKLENLVQEELNEVFDYPNEKGFLFDEVVYLTAPQTAFDNLSSRRFSHKDTILFDEHIQKTELKVVYENIIADRSILYDIDKQLDYVQEEFPDKLEAFRKAMWRNIQHYPIEEQLKWLTEYSNFRNVYKGRLKVVNLGVDDLRDEKTITDEVGKWSVKYFSERKEANHIINVSLGSTETQVAWHILAEAGQLPTNTRFIKTYDDKAAKKESRFKTFSIQEIPTNLLSSISLGFAFYPDTKSHLRALVNKKMEAFLASGFSILLIGERGIGKSMIAGRARDSLDKSTPFVEANCASFDEDNKAEAELFGYEKGAFTDAKALKKGLLEEAHDGILFLDEIHHLSKLVQAKLMKALQTDSQNKMSIRRMASNKEIKVSCRLIFATNKSIQELREVLLPDFYDRIVQHVIYIPPLRETVQDRSADWESTWKALKFKENPEVPKEPELLKWLASLPLYGNYRDLQKIAMYYSIFNQFDEETRNMLSSSSAFQYAKSEFEKYHSPAVQLENERYNFNLAQTTKEMTADYLYALQEWAVNKFGSRKAAVEHFKAKGDTVTDKTFNNWKNKRTSKSRPT